MVKKEQQIKTEALEIIELAIEDLTTLAKAFNLVSDLGARHCDFSDVEFTSEPEALLH